MKTPTLVILLLVVVVVVLIPHIQAQYFKEGIDFYRAYDKGGEVPESQIRRLMIMDRKAMVRERGRIRLSAEEKIIKKAEFWKGLFQFFKRGGRPYGCAGFACVHTHLIGDYRWRHKGTKESEAFVSYILSCRRDPNCVYGEWFPHLVILEYNVT